MIGNCKKKAVDNRTEDVIIDLPRNVIDCILERMPLRDAARTSIMSRQWRYIWATHPQLVLDKHFYEETVKNTPFVQYDFVNIINKILLLHRGPILKFILYIPNYNFDLNPDVDQWILFLSRNGIKELTIHNSNHSPYKLPSYIFSCPELTNLKLFHCIIKPLPAFSSTPLLENLIFVTCIGIDHYNICAPKLKFLHVHNALEFKSISFRNTPNLAVVLISQCSEVDNSDQGKNPINLNELLGSLPRIENLMLGGTFLKVLVTGTVPKRLPTTVTLLPNLYFH